MGRGSLPGPPAWGEKTGPPGHRLRVRLTPVARHGRRKPKRRRQAATLQSEGGMRDCYRAVLSNSQASGKRVLACSRSVLDFASFVPTAGRAALFVTVQLAGTSASGSTATTVPTASGSELRMTTTNPARMYLTTYTVPSLHSRPDAMFHGTSRVPLQAASHRRSHRRRLLRRGMGGSGGRRRRDGLCHGATGGLAMSDRRPCSTDRGRPFAVHSHVAP